MNKYLLSALCAGIFCFESATAQKLPAPAHIVLVIDENQSYNGIIGSSSAPYINSLLNDSNTATFTKMYANSSAASQPNYLYLFSGSDQGVTSNTIPSNTPFTTCNIGGSLVSAGKTFSGYCEGLPSAGYLGTTSGNYDRKHNPISDWQGTLANNYPASCNKPYSAFPTNYDSLPTFSFVVPDEVDNMHSSSIQNGDTWLKNNFADYIAWAKTHNSLFIFTFDEDDGTANEHIALLFIGSMVKHGSYSENISFLNVLRTIEDMYQLPTCAGSSSATDITDVWKSNSGTANEVNSFNSLNVWPVPAKDLLHLDIHSSSFSENAVMTVYDLTGRKMMEQNMTLQEGENNFSVKVPVLVPGVYYMSLNGRDINCSKKIIIE
jgi:hypothetical protein